MFSLSNRSNFRLEGVHPLLVDTVRLAIAKTRVDFGVTCGVRTIDEQKKLVASGASHTMNSLHLKQGDGFGHAVDLVAYVGSRVSWELNLYDDIADAMKESAKVTGAPLRWGAAWNVPDIREWDGFMGEAMQSYIDLRRSQGKRPFIDGPHFELRL